jgi:hypothetical protein
VLYQARVNPLLYAVQHLKLSHLEAVFM